jgi:hypothetical protein
MLFRRSRMVIQNYLVRLHRWLGVCLCVPFLVWFSSGFILMYCDYPAVSELGRLERLAPLQKDFVRISPAEAAARAGVSQPDEARLSSILSRPVYRFRSLGRIAVVYADSGEVFHGFQEEQARQVGAAWTHLRPEDARLETRQIQEDDQWTVQQHYRMYRPLWKFAWPDGDETYVSEEGRNLEPRRSFHLRSRDNRHISGLAHRLLDVLSDQTLSIPRIAVAYSVLRADAMAHGSRPHIRLRDIHLDSERFVLDGSHSLA